MTSLYLITSVLVLSGNVNIVHTQQHGESIWKRMIKGAVFVSCSLSSGLCRLCLRLKTWSFWAAAHHHHHNDVVLYFINLLCAQTCWKDYLFSSTLAEIRKPNRPAPPLLVSSDGEEMLPTQAKEVNTRLLAAVGSLATNQELDSARDPLDCRDGPLRSFWMDRSVLAKIEHFLSPFHKQPITCIVTAELGELSSNYLLSNFTGGQV